MPSNIDFVHSIKLNGNLISSFANCCLKVLTKSGVCAKKKKVKGKFTLLVVLEGISGWVSDLCGSCFDFQFCGKDLGASRRIVANSLGQCLRF